MRARSDWLLKLPKAFAIHLRATRAGFEPENIVIVAGINELKSPLCAVKWIYVLDYQEFNFTFSMQLSGVANHKLFKEISNPPKLSTFYRQVTNTLQTVRRLSANRWPTSKQLSFQQNVNKDVCRLLAEFNSLINNIFLMSL